MKSYYGEIGRDYSGLLKTKLATVMFASSKEDAAKKIEQFRRPWMSLESYLNSFLLGSQSEISDQVSKLAADGIDYLIIDFRGKYTPNNHVTFANEGMSRF